MINVFKNKEVILCAELQVGFPTEKTLMETST